MTKLPTAIGLTICFFGVVNCLGQDASGRAHSDYTLGVSPQERQALVDLYDATGGDHWKRHDGWLGPAGNECNWYGVTCGGGLGPTSVAVIDLVLQENNLAGSVPDR